MRLIHKATKVASTVVTTAVLICAAGTAQAAFQGRDASGAASSSCTATGASKCTYFYDTTLGITILNNWNIGGGPWSASAAAGSAQALAASAGLSTSGLTGWVLPTGDGGAAAGPQNQYSSIWNSVGSTFQGLSGQFGGVQSGNYGYYWSSTVFSPDPSLHAWGFRTDNGAQGGTAPQAYQLFAVAVRPGDVAAAVPEPQTYAMLLLGLGALMVVVRRRPR
jgi:hypothetical protein